jgi:adenosylcobinamide-GDP ribazoletransferase
MRFLRKLALTISYVSSFHFFKPASSEEELRGLSVYLPTVGIFIGTLLFTVYWLLNLIDCANLLRAFLITGCWLMATGCIHLDGLMDAADGLFSHRDRDRMLEIMRDSRVGNFGAISGVMLLAAKICALAIMPEKWMFPALLLIPAWARWSEVFAIAFFPYARAEGMGRIWHDSTEKQDLLPALALPGLLSLAVCFYLNSAAISFLIPLAVLPGIFFASRINCILSGHTGDTYGAVVELSEASALILLALFSKFLQF